MHLDETDGYRMRRTGEKDVKRTHSLFIDDLKIYQESHKKLEVANEIIVKASMDTVACYGVKKWAEVILSNGKMVKGEELNVLEEQMIAQNPQKNKAGKFSGANVEISQECQINFEKLNFGLNHPNIPVV